MGVMLSVLVASVGAMDLIYCLAYVSNQVTEGPPPTTDDGAGLEQYRKAVSEQLTAAPRSTIEGITVAQDGVPYRDGYRVEQFDEARLDALGVKIRDLERRSQEKEQRLEQLNVALRELERKSVERELQGRSRPVSRAPSPERPESGTGTDVLVASPTLPQIVLDDGGGGGAGAEPRPSSSKFRPIRRDDETRRSVKRRSVASNASQDDRAEELLLLSQLEEEEAAHMQDYVPLTYARDEHSAAVDAFGKRHKISPIPELCQMHEDEDRQWVPERSPEPTLAANITRPWGDIKMDEVKERAVIARRSARSLSIEEVETPRHSQSEGEEESRPGPQLRACETVPANLSRASSRSVSPDHAEQPTLRRTTKETDLASLLLLTVPDGADRKDTSTAFDGSRSPTLPTVGPNLSPRQSSSSPSTQPRRKERKRRVARSLTPIHYDQTFMDSFTEQRLSVSPAELEDYINSMDSIDFVPPPPLSPPPFLYRPRAIPSLVLTDAQGSDAQFHADLSTRSFYGGTEGHPDVPLNHRVSYGEWLKKFPEHQSSHLSLEDFDSDDEEVETITRNADRGEAVGDGLLFPTGRGAGSGEETPRLPMAAVAPSPVATPEPTTILEHTQFPVNVPALYSTPSPVSPVSPVSDLSDLSSSPVTVSPRPTSPDQPLTVTVRLSSPAPETHFTPIPLTTLDAPDRQQRSLTPTNVTTPIHSLRVSGSRSPSVSPVPVDISPEELVFEIGHLDGLIFEAKSREPSPAPARQPLLSPDELAFDIGNLGGLILGPPSRSVSPVPPSRTLNGSPTPDGKE
ncbi:soluble scavenger receptor cysteine-rich domain-containing protein SSC5D isoform X2 [Anopheles cruzii]|uniref:soluble scavenger receptor cysteine-rich domain-containing protein SSC5D isoform X2 n=1 Tax=Anopheles cruzii TaxID=68878 RepID=UPI0022EC27DD|nr:soluble scavenger receptor cysteine-rich domain-containing protein SSC5D isoform X2 [Anopheles cruzii]